MIFRRFATTIALTLLAFAPPAFAGQPTTDKSSEDEEKDVMSAETFAGLELRNIGPALASGRVVDFAVDLNNRARYYVAVASGGVWKTVNGGTTFTPVFDKTGSYSIGCVTMDPRNPSVVWVGAGENNSQRSVSFGDGVYKTVDGGANWTNMGLKDSQHIGMVAIDPRDSNTVYVAAQGPLWNTGGDRGLYKTTDGGATWQRVLHISDDTGVNEVHLDPRNPDVIYASAYQRRRHVWTLIDGGPESAIYKSTDAGQNWRKITQGLPEVDMGRIGLDISPANPDVIYAIIEAADDKSGFYRSTDRGETWERRSDHKTTSPQYYSEIVCDPLDVDRVYALDTFTHVTEDGGKSFHRTPREHRHVDDHALWIDPSDTDYLLMGCDGGVYESFERGQNWRFMPNLPVSQFYRVSVDNSEPFYFIYGGTQDNNSMGGPSRTRSPAGIVNEDWFVTVGGDGYETQVDPTDPNIVYSLWQYGGLVRFDRQSGEIVDIKPREKPDDAPYRWNWDTPLIISPHSHTRLYVAAQRLFRSDDRGNSWTPISDDLTRQLDRNQLEILGSIQRPDAVAKHESTSYYGNCVALSESPLVAGLIYVGTDDGLIQVTEDDGQNWRRVDTFPGVPEMTYVSRVTASRHDPDRVYAAFDNHKQGDFKPYILVSQDRGRTWESATGELAEQEIVYAVEEDHVKPDLLFAGTEFGVWFSPDAGHRWIELTGGMPPIAVRDIDIQRRESDLVLGTFGRGFYILDDYSPLRQANESLLERGPTLFPVKDALRYIESSRLGGTSGRGSQGPPYYPAPNPPFGAVFTYYLKDKIETKKEQRQQAEKDAREAGSDLVYPSIDELRAEDLETEPTVVLIVRNEQGEVVRRVTGPREKGMHRVAWDLRFPSSTPVELKDAEDRPPWSRAPQGPLALPGTYTATLAVESEGVITELAGPQSFEVKPLEIGTFTAEDRTAVLVFREKVADLHRAVRGAIKAANEAQTRIDCLRKALLETPNADLSRMADIRDLDRRLKRIKAKLSGDPTLVKRNEPLPPSISERVEQIVGDQWYSTTAPTETQRDAYRYAGEAFADVLNDLRTLVDDDIKSLEDELESAGAPWTPGRIPAWKPS